jgi:hypothetical protein
MDREAGIAVTRQLTWVLAASLALAECGSGQATRTTVDHTSSQASACASAACKTDYRILLARTALPGNRPVVGESLDAWYLQQIVQVGAAGQLKEFSGGTGATFRTACLLAAEKAER